MRGSELKRWRTLPSRGTLLINTDLHGNRADFERLVSIFRSLEAKDPDTHWVILGDLVHGPNVEARGRFDGLYDFDDESWAVVAGVMAEIDARPGRVHFVLGNHDHAHVGGPHTSKFHQDEVAHLEGGLDADQIARMHACFSEALLAVVAPCGLLLTHGAPSDELRSLADLDRMSLHPDENPPELNRGLRSLLTHYGQPPEEADRLLARLSAEVGFRLSTIVHGHDKVEEGWFVDGHNQLCPVIFGARREEKRYVVVDLAGRYDRTSDLRDGFELRRLYD